MDCDTKIGGKESRFPDTRDSAIARLASADGSDTGAEYERIVAEYWKPVYKYIRIRYRKSNEDAKDLTQAFFAAAMEKQYFRAYCRQRAAFRTFLRACLDHFVANASRRDRRQPGSLALAPGAAEREIEDLSVDSVSNPEEFLYREWQRELFSKAVIRLRRECLSSGRQTQFRAFERYILDGDCSYEEASAELGVSVIDLTNYLFAMRGRFRRIARELMGTGAAA
ncbi:MAG: RNA polymerase sigma factor [Bryobacteraceae bacterium]